MAQTIEFRYDTQLLLEPVDDEELDVDEIRDYIASEIKKRVPNVTDIIIEFDQDDEIVHWKKTIIEKPVE